jgi:hypothetical protein
MSPPPPNHLIDSSVQDQWFDEHLDIEVYDFNSVDVYEYRNGLHVYSGTDYGKWGRLSGTENEPLHDDDAAFEGAYAWLAGHAGVDKDAPDFGDNPEHPKIYIVDGTVHVRYRFENNNGGTTDYGLHIQRSTGRYTETFTPSNMDAFEHAGTCMIFQQ